MNYSTRLARRYVAVGASTALTVSLAASVGLTSSASAAGTACGRAASAFSGFVGSDTDPLAGASVDLYTDPDLSKLKVGQSANLIKLGSATTDSDGCFQVPATAAWTSSAKFGTLDVRAFIHRPDQLEMRVVPVAVAKSSAGATTISTPRELSAAMAAASEPVFETFTGTEMVAPAGAVASVGSSASGYKPVAARAASTPASAFLKDPPTARGGGGTRWTKIDDFGKRPVLVGQWWSKTPNVEQTWRYSQGATSSLEAAFTLAGDGGEYKHSETNTTSTTSSVGFPKVTGKAGKYFRTYFAYGRYKLEEFDYVTGRWYYIGKWVRRTTWERGQQITSGVSVPATKPENCSRYAKGGDDTTETSTAVTWTDGVSLSGTMKGILGSISLSSRTGFEKAATNYVLFTARGRLCGVYGPLSKPGALVARKPA